MTEHDPAARELLHEQIRTQRTRTKVAEAQLARLAPAAPSPPRVVTDTERLRAEVDALPFVGPVALARALERAAEAKIDINYRAARESLARLSRCNREGDEMRQTKKTTTISVEEDDSTKCRSCGALNSEDAAYCKSCGEPMTDDTTDAETGARTVVHRDRQGGMTMTMAHPSLAAMEPPHVFELPTAATTKGRR